MAKLQISPYYFGSEIINNSLKYIAQFYDDNIYNTMPNFMMANFAIQCPN